MLEPPALRFGPLIAYEIRFEIDGVLGWRFFEKLYIKGKFSYSLSPSSLSISIKFSIQAKVFIYLNFFVQQTSSIIEDAMLDRSPLISQIIWAMISREYLGILVLFCTASGVLYIHKIDFQRKLFVSHILLHFLHCSFHPHLLEVS